MELKRSICYSIVYPHVSEISNKNKIAAFKWASAVIDCISIVLRQSRGWSKIPGVSMTCHLAYLYSQCPTNRFCVVKGQGYTSTFAFVTLLMKDDLPTFGNPVTIKVRAFVSIWGRRAKCFLTSSKYAKLDFNFLSIVQVRPRAALFSILHLYRESAYLSNLTQSFAILSQILFALFTCPRASL